MKKYSIIYKCRMCGKCIETGKHSFSEDIVDAVSIDTQDAGDKDSFIFHTCDNGDIGVCEFQGFRNTGEEAGYNDILHDALQKQNRKTSP